MAFEEVLQNVTVEAAGDLSAAQYHFVKLDTNDQAVLCDAAGEQAYGVLQNTPEAAGRAGTVARDGITKVVAGEAIALGDEVATNASGRAVTALVGNTVLGIARTACNNDGEIVSVDFDRNLGTA